MSKIIVGQDAPDGAVYTIGNQIVRLSELWANGRCTMLIFLRHLA